MYSLWSVYFFLPIFCLMSLLPNKIQCLSYILLLLAHFIFLDISEKNYDRSNFLTLLLSYSLCYCFFLISNFIASFLLNIVSWFLLNKYEFDLVILQITIFLTMLTLCTLLFHIKRLSNGMPFLKKQISIYPVCLISILVFICIMLISNQNVKNQIYHPTKSFLSSLILILFVSIFIWWQEQLQQSYLDKLRKRDIERLEAKLADCQLTIASLEEENKQQAHLIHRDNKQIAALELAVESYLTTDYTNMDTQKEYGQKLLTELQKENFERKQMISDITTTNHLSPTNILSIDNMLNLMLQRCHSHNITLDFSLHGTIEYFLKQITEKDFLTLLADLLENALIATIHGQGTAILLHIGTMDEHCFISVWDSGIPFTKEVLLHLGKKPYTTHKEDGGSGIGLVSTYELLQKYQASLHIDECISSKNDYTKQVSILFDNKKEYHLITNRDADELSYLRQRSDLQISQK